MAIKGSEKLAFLTITLVGNVPNTLYPRRLGRTSKKLITDGHSLERMLLAMLVHKNKKRSSHAYSGH